MEEEWRKWEDLEIDCLSNIFRRLALEELILDVSFVCKSWYKASLDPLCWQILNFEKLDFSPESRFAKKFKGKYAILNFSFAGFMNLVVGRSCGLATELRFPLDGVSIQDLVSAANKCPKLKVLALPNMTLENELQIPQLVAKYKDLEHLEMDVKPSCFSELAAEISNNCKNFRGLKMSGSIQKSDASAIVGFMPKIKYLDLSRSYLPKKEFMVIMKGCREIERLSVNFCVGFQVDKDVLELASSIGLFECEGSKLCDYFVYDSFHWNQLYLNVEDFL
ncbi:F-box/LRR-repeat protein At3g48880-like [Asparagus officinalis]|uniref:F-box/LRR-repeat protein At3g48880-like n=1 Tax=Asparagus officinalis TaxID=4686 RepID=UPI00098E4FA8|nr:F-box/LRR-repeat protein At3g48880-like [Asparagus officinalis]